MIKRYSGRDSSMGKQARRSLRFGAVLVLAGAAGACNNRESPSGDSPSGDLERHSSGLVVGPGQDLNNIPGIAPGVTIYVKPGVYGPVTFTVPGVTLQGLRDEDGNRPEITGSSSPDSDDYKATVVFEGADNMVFAGFDVSGGVGKCIFNIAKNLTIADTVVHDCENHGILGA